MFGPVKIYAQIYLQAPAETSLSRSLQINLRINLDGTKQLGESGKGGQEQLKSNAGMIPGVLFMPRCGFCCGFCHLLTTHAKRKKPQNHCGFKVFPWSCWADSNCRPHPYQGCALPTELQQQMATRKGFEPSTSGVTGRRSNQLNYLAIY